MHEKVYKGIVASPGIVIGRAYLSTAANCGGGTEDRGGQHRDEVARFKRAVDLSRPTGRT
jgi:hypothetical protein